MISLRDKNLVCNYAYAKVEEGWIIVKSKKSKSPQSSYDMSIHFLKDKVEGKS